MENLKNSGLELRNITATDYATLVENLQYNFLQILNVPGFKGLPGDSVIGPEGVGIRGSKWIFVKLTDFPQLQSINEISLQFVNSNFQNDPQEFVSHLQIPDDQNLVYGDVLVLPSGQLIQLISNEVNDVFIDTGISFNQVSSLTASEVISIVQSLLGDSQDNTSFRYFNAVAKNASDASPSQNSEATVDSAIDIVTSTSGPGFLLTKNKFYGPAETQITADMFVMQIVGSVNRYHELIQQTQIQKTNAYLPGVDDWASMAILQNSYGNGIVFGHKNSETMYDFARLYKSANATILTSHYSSILDEYSELQLSAKQALIRAQNEIEVRTNIFRITSTQLITNMFSYYGDELVLGLGNSKVVFDAMKGIYLDRLKNANFLSTDADGRIVKAFSVATDMNSPSLTKIVNTLMLSTLITNLNLTLDDHQESIDNLQNSDNVKNFKLLHHITTTSDSTLKNINNHIAMGYSVFDINMFSATNSPIYSETVPADTTTTSRLKTFISEKSANVRLLEQEILIVITTAEIKSYKKFRRFGKNDNAAITWNVWIEENVGVVGDAFVSIIDNKLIHAAQVAINHDEADEINVVKSIKTNAAGHVIDVQKTNVLQRLAAMETKIQTLESEKVVKYLLKGTHWIGNIAPDDIKTVSFSSVGTNNYMVAGSLISTSSDYKLDNDVTWVIREKTATSFKIALREMDPIMQNLSFDYILMPMST